MFDMGCSLCHHPNGMIRSYFPADATSQEMWVRCPFFPTSSRIGCVKCFPPEVFTSPSKAKMFSAFCRVSYGMSKCSTSSLLITKMFDPESSKTRMRIRFPAASIYAGPSGQ